MIDAIVGGLVGSIVPVALGGIAFAMAWGNLSEKVETLGREMGERKDWEDEHIKLHLTKQGD
mgnify:CR=1 FL=1